MKNISKILLATCLLFFGGRVDCSEYIHVNLLPISFGMFSVFSYVSGILYHYDLGTYEGLKVDFEDRGLYYDSNHGPNWWQYYCEPIFLGDMKSGKVKTFDFVEYHRYAFFVEKKLNRKQVNQIIQKYIKIKPAIQQKIDDFAKEKFSNSFILSVHYRGTDKFIKEAVEVPYSRVMKKIKKYIKSKELTKYKIFIATDEESFITAAKKAFPNNVIAYNSIRSTNGQPIHFNVDDHLKTDDYNYRIGEEALIDCLLLSKGNVLFRTSSNLSLWSSYFNPDIPVIDLSVRK